MKPYILNIRNQSTITETFMSNDLDELIERAKFVKSLKRYKAKTISVSVECGDELLFSIGYDRITRTIEPPTRTIEDILSEVVERHGVTVDDLCRRDRKRSLTDVRAEFYYICLKHGNHPETVGESIKRSRSNVITMAKKYQYLFVD